MNTLTPAQQQAVRARGNVLVMAGAGTGKTRTLVERCLECVGAAADSVSLDEILVVTFTEAAAAEVRKRIRAGLEQRAAQAPSSLWLSEQLALIDAAPISTLHSFCLQLIRTHFYELGLDPQVSVLSEEQAQLLAREVLDGLLARHYTGGTALAEAVQQLILEQGRGWDRPIRRLVLRLHHYIQTRHDPARWWDQQWTALQQSEPHLWLRWLEDGFADWRKEWLDTLTAQPADNANAHKCARWLNDLPAPATRASIDHVLAQILAMGQDDHWPHGTKGRFREPIRKLFDEAAFLHSIAAVPPPEPAHPPATSADPLAEDWNWVRPQMAALLQLTHEFELDFARAKREQGAVDFHDLEQFALQLLRDPQINGPTLLARQWRQKLRLLFVDEYQDINEAQDAILRMLARDGAAANRFLVGDAKQSIYRFRLADPRIFLQYASCWRQGAPDSGVLSLTDNFRSHESILNFVNALFCALMRPELGGLRFDEEAKLQFGARETRAALSVAAAPTGASRVELHLLLTGMTATDEAGAEESESTEGPTLADLSSQEKEARLVALRLRELRAQSFQVWDSKHNQPRPVDWRDMVILLRSPRYKAETYAKEFDRLGVPLVAARGGFYQSTEITDLLSLMQLLDNPCQDLPLLAVLRSPLAGLALDELARIRLAHRQGYFWTALQQFQKAGEPGFGAGSPGPSEISVPAPTPAPGPRSPSAEHGTHDKVDRFLDRFGRWRELSLQVALSQCLETILDDTFYPDWLLTQLRGHQRAANVQRLLALTRQFDQFQRQGLFRFLQFVEAQLEAEAETEPAPISPENAVQLMSIHQSKGLEFPVVVVADLAKRFNFDDLKGTLIIDEQFGLCPQVKPPQTGQRYPSLPYWLAQRRQRAQTLAEEMRLLYVALTRAADRLILTGTAARKAASETWSQEAASILPLPQILGAQSYLDWLGRWLPAATGHTDWTTNGHTPLLEWRVLAEDHPDLNRVEADIKDPSATRSEAAPIEPEAFAALRERLEWSYPFAPATLEPAKTSVSILRRKLAPDTDEEAHPLFAFQVPKPADSASTRNEAPAGHRGLDRPPAAGEGGRAPPLRGSGGAPVGPTPPGELSPAEVGTAHHAFLQFVSLDEVHSPATLRQAAQRIQHKGLLTDAQVASLDFAALAAFWQSELGQKIRAQAPFIHRELPFTARFAPADLIGLIENDAQETSSDALPPPPRLQRAQEPLPLPATSTDEFIVVQGVADLAVLLPAEIWLLDYKTDRVPPDAVGDKVKTYAPQLALYASALSRIYHRPVTHAWLHFLALGKTVAIKLH